MCSRVVKHRTQNQRLRAFCLTRSAGDTARHRMLWWNSGCLRSCNRAFRSKLEAARREFENAKRAFSLATSQGAAATAEFMRRQYPNAVQCPRCHAGPVIPRHCWNLELQHGESLEIGRGRISNAKRSRPVAECGINAFLRAGASSYVLQAHS